jgi:hypothetical protein
MWGFLGALAAIGIVVLLLKAAERRASKELDGDQEMCRILRERLGRNDCSGGFPGDGEGPASKPHPLRGRLRHCAATGPAESVSETARISL